MSWTPEAAAVLEALRALPALDALGAALERGELDETSLGERLGALINDDPRLLALTIGERDVVLGRLRAALKRRIPPPPGTLGPGERVLGLSGDALGAWRASRVAELVSPVAYLFDQARHGLEQPPGSPRRRDLAWDIVNAGITAVRYAAVVAIADYVDGGLADPHLNRALLETLRKPADGHWGQLLFAPQGAARANGLLAVLAARPVRVVALEALGESLARADLPPELIDLGGEVVAKVRSELKSPSVQGLTQAFVVVRNALVHGAYARQRPADAELALLGRLLDVLVEALRPVLELPVWVREGDRVLRARGTVLAEDGSADPPSLPDALAGQPVLCVGDRKLTLSPWLSVADLAAAVELAHGAEVGERSVGLSELCFFNRFESDTLHYLGFAARAQLPHAALLEQGRTEEAFRAFSQHVESLRLQSAPAHSRKADPVMRFDALAASHAENFVGRRDLIDAIERFVAEPPAPMGVITAEPGMGKSALLTHFYREHGAEASADGWIFHFSARAEQRDNPILGLRSLIAQADRQRLRLSAAKAQPMPLPWTYDDLRARFHDALAALGQAARGAGRRAVLVIDALDEQAPRPGAPPDSIFSAVPDEVPDGVVVLVSVRIDGSGRPVSVEPGRLAAPRGRPIPGAAPLGGLGPDDVAELVRDRLADAREGLPPVSDAVLARIAEVARRPTDGTLDPFYLRFLADAVREGAVDLSDVGSVPEGLESFFDDLWWGLDIDRDFLLHRVLGMLAEMEGFGDDALFGTALDVPVEEVGRLRFGINKWLILTPGADGGVRYGLFHDRFRWYVRSRIHDRARAVWLHAPLLRACIQAPSVADHYGVRFRSFHRMHLARHPGLTEAEREDHAEALWRLLFDDDWARDSFDALGDEVGVVTDLQRAFEVFRPRADDPEARQWERAGRVTWLAERGARLVAQLANQARARLMDDARAGEVVRVIRLAERASSTGLQWMTLLRAARAMREVALDPTPLFEAILAHPAPRLLWTDAAPLAWLLDEADAPEAIREAVRGHLPARDDGHGLGVQP